MEYLSTDKLNNEALLVSVVVPTYQHSSYIRECLNSILMQKTNFPIEIILGEDQSDDGTREVCIEYAEKYPGIIRLFLRNRKDVIYINGSATGRFNFIENLKAAKGKYIAICEGDDYWTDPYKLQKQVDFLEANDDFTICFHKVDVLKEGIMAEDHITKVPAEITSLKDLLITNYMHSCSVLFRNIIPIPDWFKKAMPGDYILWMLLTKDGGKIKYLNSSMGVYRIHAGGVWSMQNPLRKFDQLIKATFLRCAIEIEASGDLFVEQKLTALRNTITKDGYKQITPGEYFFLVRLASKRLHYNWYKQLSFLLPRTMKLKSKALLSLKQRYSQLNDKIFKSS